MREPIRFSLLKEMGRSAMHYRYALDHPREDTLSLRLGRLTDHLLFRAEPPIVWDGARRGKGWEAFAAEHEGEDVFTASELAGAELMAAAVKAHPAAMELLEGERQRRIHWEWLGLQCRGTPDVFAPRRLVDLKSTRNAQPDWFQRDALRYGYHAQLAWYRQGLRLSGLADPTECYLISVESEPPNPIVIHQLSERTLVEGEKCCRLWAERLLACEQADVWPGYCESIVPFDIPDLDALVLNVDGEEIAA